MIRSVELTNWKTHKSTKMEFQKGVNVLVGIMGSGKSSMMDAITFALFGNFPALKRKSTRLADVLMSRPTAENTASVRLGFDIGQDEYCVTRVISKRGSGEAKQSEAKLEKNGNYVQAQAERVTEEIGRLLKIDYDTFTRAIYSEQNNLEYFLNLEKGSRKREIDGMLRLDAFAKAKENATSVMNSINSLVKEQERMVAQMDIKAIEQQLNKLNEEKAAVKVEVEELQATSAKRKEGLTAIESKLKDAKGLYQKWLALSREIAELASKISTLEQNIKGLGRPEYDADKLKSETKNLKSIKSALEDEIAEIEKRKESLTREWAGINEQLKRADKDQKEKQKLQDHLKGIKLDEINNQIKHYGEQIQKFSEDIAAWRSKLREAEELIDILGRETSVCPVCGRDLNDELKSHIHKKKDVEITNLQKEIVEQAKQLEKIKKEAELLTERQKDLALAQKRLEDYKDIEKVGKELSIKESNLGKELKKVAELLETNRSELKQKGEKLTEMEKMLDAAILRLNYEEQKEGVGVLLAKKKKEHESIAINEKDIDALEKTFRDESNRFAEVGSKITSSKRYLDSVSKQIDEKTQEYKNYKTLQDRIGTYKACSLSMHKFKEALVGTEIALRTRLVSSINVLLSDLWRGLYPYGDYNGLALDASEDDYALQADIGVGGTSVWVPVDSVASGGERSVACLALRIALSMVLVPNLRWLILDEPTHNIDAAGIDKLIEVFGGSLPNIVEQIFIITHDENLKQIGSAKVYTLDRDKSVSGPTVVAEN